MPTITPAIVAATMLAFAVPAAAATLSQGESMQAKAIQKDGKTLYCVETMTTGSILSQTTCLTKAQWQERGAVVAGTEKAHKLASNPQPANHI